MRGIAIESRELSILQDAHCLVNVSKLAQCFYLVATTISEQPISSCGQIKAISVYPILSPRPHITREECSYNSAVSQNTEGGNHRLVEEIALLPSLLWGTDLRVVDYCLLCLPQSCCDMDADIAPRFTARRG